MRLSASERQAICETVESACSRRGIEYALYLHGSRTNDQAKGGDIDLALIIGKPSSTDLSILALKLEILADIKARIGEQKMDLAVEESEACLTSPFLQTILPGAKLLFRRGQGHFRKTMIHDRVEQARTGKNPYVVAKLQSGWLVLGDTQFLIGYSLLLPDPVVPDLNSLDSSARARFFADLGAVSDALLRITGADRINLEILGNSEPALHAHLFPRYRNEPASDREHPAWNHSWRKNPEPPPEQVSLFKNCLAEALEGT